MPLRGTQNPMKMGSGSCMLRLRPWHRVEAVFVSGAFNPYMSLRFLTEQGDVDGGPGVSPGE